MARFDLTDYFIVHKKTCAGRIGAKIHQTSGKNINTSFWETPVSSISAICRAVCLVMSTGVNPAASSICRVPFRLCGQMRYSCMG